VSAIRATLPSTSEPWHHQARLSVFSSVELLVVVNCALSPIPAQTATMYPHAEIICGSTPSIQWRSARMMANAAEPIDKAIFRTPFQNAELLAKNRYLSSLNIFSFCFEFAIYLFRVD
jgi:hypothetical protein